ncbi:MULTISPECIES: 5'-methylthioadenosine/adenosylhomocysteine nucleosidase [unclassified Granulicatella]|uniref:5'-methylthioadenosine/adenosylhomocysteine nucleosidase n=1 Tax=unclassified Granulicatella TaxID=2630493 RepID=UPI0010730266|nr:MULTISPECIES: 5'-methylthioadenosine/adenosylhomocysteine nucleosidase [unclassified Granulicatella]MBF0779884.1 5'-methylthioadenosine/adenosylhomocysteine nucleosidase [Granulicatella sp. 19428wC4_WM01]TFU96088.1 5'-methylthioadenosine/adenosylhomocysteine nucleosidase [Granulicatella sp. WM01]
MKIGIIGAMAQETELLLSRMMYRIEEKKHHLTFVLGPLNGHDVVLVQSGIGKVNSTIATTLLITHYKVDYVINTGSAGSLAQLSIGDVVISNQVAYHDVNVTAFGYAIGQVPQMPLYYEADDTLVQLAYKAVQSCHLRANIGEIVSSDSFIDSQEKIHTIQTHFPKALCTEMEGASIAQTCHILNVPFVIVRAISDNADGKAPVSFDEFIVTAGENSAKMVLEILENLA